MAGATQVHCPWRLHHQSDGQAEQRLRGDQDQRSPIVDSSPASTSLFLTLRQPLSCIDDKGLPAQELPPVPFRPHRLARLYRGHPTPPRESPLAPAAAPRVERKATPARVPTDFATALPHAQRRQRALTATKFDSTDSPPSEEEPAAQPR